jgi:hypothetical protein
MPQVLHYALGIVAALAAATILLTIAAVAAGEYLLRRSIRVAAAALCPGCRKPLGRWVVIAAKRRYARKVREMVAKRPEMKFKIAAEWEIECPRCRYRFYFYPGKNRIETKSLSK